ncbi:MAG: hydrogenase maturation nickel metallochaperone HypA [Alphaproteobacteria bacterium]
MHEMSLAQGVIDAIEAQAARDAFTRATRVVLEVGVLSCVDAHALEFCFGAVSRDTRAQGAVLEIRTPPGRAHCFGCDGDVLIARRGEGCPDCGSHRLIVTGGEELKVKEMEVV